MLPDPFSLLLVFSGVFLIAFMRGAFGGGFAIIGIPLLSLRLDPITAGALLAPFVVNDLFALRYWKPGTWSKPDLKLLVPALLIGIAVGTVLMRILDRHVIEIAMALITLLFAALWFMGGGKVQSEPRKPAKGLFAGFCSGVTTMVAHAGGPPLAMYLLPLGLPKSVMAGTTSLFFTVGNVAKAGPWLWLAQPGRDIWLLMLICVPVIPLAIWAGWRLHERLDQQKLYRVCYGLLIVTAMKLLWDGVSGLMHG
jgi:uncharacterized membrane protein YfcA